MFNETSIWSWQNKAIISFFCEMSKQLFSIFNIEFA